MKVDKKYIYTDDETGKDVYDYCYNCNNVVLQEDDGSGRFRCEICKEYDHINIIEVEEEDNKDYETAIIIIDVVVDDAIQLCESIEGKYFENEKAIYEYLKLNKEQAEIYSLTDFVDLSNNQNFNYENSFISFVNLKYEVQ